VNPLSKNVPLQAVSGLSTDRLAADSRSLDALRREASSDPRAAVKKAATQFEALFMQMVLKSMRDAMPKSGLLGDDAGQQMVTGLLDQQLATKMAASGTGLADVIAKQLTRHMTAVAGDSPVVPVQAGTRDGALAGSPLLQGRQRRAEPAASEPAKPAPHVSGPASNAAGGPASDAATVGSVGPAGPAGQGTAQAPQALRDAMRQFVNRHWDHALAAERATGIPAKFAIAQAAHESGWGRHEIRGADGLASHNLFGIKAGSGWQGRTVDVVTTEYDNGVARKVVEKFRAYNNYSEAFRDWARLLAANPRYAGAVAAGADANAFATGLQRGGYATDPDYADKVQRAIGAVGRLRGVA
jgi:flagellar protein FlgJ